MNPILLGLILGVLSLISGCGNESDSITDPAVLKRGTRIAKSCGACHRLEKRENGVGPNLVGILQRDAGDVSDYAYSEVFKQANFEWNSESIKQFLMNPQKVMPGTKMAIAGLSSADAEALIIYLRSIE